MLSYIFMKILEARPRSYDRRMDRFSRGKVARIKEAVVAEIPERAEVLEIGCGTGELAAMLIARGATVTGFDLNPEMIEVAREKIEEEGLGNRFTLGEMGVDGMDLFPSSCFDAVVSTLSFSELSNDERRFTLRHAERVLKPGGLIVIADEVVPRTLLRKLVKACVRIPMLAATYLASGASTRPIADLPVEIEDAGFEVSKEIRSQGDAFALVVGVRKDKE